MQNVGFDMSFEQRLARVDLTNVMAKVVAEHGLSAANAVVAEDLYRKFLTLAARYPDALLVPPAIADLVWHEHISATRQYHTDCELLFGAYMHHDARDEDMTEFYRTGTLAMMERDFGVKLDTSDAMYAAAPCGR